MRLRVLASFVCCWAAVAAAQSVPASGTAQSAASNFEIHGTVTAGKMPLPGVNISAANSLTGKKVITSIDPDGHYEVVVPGRGKYVVRADLTAFAAATAEVMINPATPQQKVDLEDRKSVV